MTELSDFSNAKLFHAEVAALARLHLFITSRTHEMMAEFSKKASGRLVAAAGKDGTLTLTEAYKAQQSMMGWWGDLISEWTKDLQKARRIAAQLPFGVMAEFHGRLVEGQMVKVQEATPLGRTYFREARVKDGVFDPQIKVLLNAASEHLYGDGLNLSQRIWKMDRDAQDMMNQIILQAVNNQTSAWDLAQELEVLLGASEDCPRWTSTRLYNMTKTEIASGDLRGLVSGDQCDGQGVAYNALRLARTELQKVHALATDKVLANSPWVEMEQVNLSKGHPEPDICDDVIHGGEKGDGVYPVGTIELPLHPNCLCYKTAVLMDEDQFIGDLRDWMRGVSTWPAMDDYADFVGAGEQVLADKDLSKDPSIIALAIWMFSQDLKL